jgi:hypothetical protein
MTSASQQRSTIFFGATTDYFSIRANVNVLFFAIGSTCFCVQYKTRVVKKHIDIL